MRSLRRQRPVQGGRERLSPYVLTAIEDAVAADAKQHHCSASFVVATILAAHYDIPDQPDFRVPDDKLKHTKLKRRK